MAKPWKRKWSEFDRRLVKLYRSLSGKEKFWKIFHHPLPRDVKELKRVADALEVPLAFFFADDNRLVELLTLWTRIDDEGRQRLVAQGEDLAGLS